MALGGVGLDSCIEGGVGPTCDVGCLVCIAAKSLLGENKSHVPLRDTCLHARSCMLWPYVIGGVMTTFRKGGGGCV